MSSVGLRDVETHLLGLSIQVTMTNVVEKSQILFVTLGKEILDGIHYLIFAGIRQWTKLSTGDLIACYIVGCKHLISPEFYLKVLGLGLSLGLMIG